MKRFRAPLLYLLLLAATLTTMMACAGGSGSSGFDISSASELAAIDRALEERQCLERKDLIICPANEQSPLVPGSPTPVPSPGPASPPSIDTLLDHTVSLSCGFVPASNSCNLSVPFTPNGFEASTRYYVAVRPNRDDAPWTIHSTRAITDASGTFHTPLQVPAEGMEIQIAILVFTTEPTSIPDQVAELADSQANYAYVTHVLMLSPR